MQVILQIFLFSIALSVSTAEVSSRSKGYCAPYNGKICKKYLTGIGQVWFNDSNDNVGGWLNEQITAGLWTDLMERLKEPCRSAAEKLLCMYAFPQCSESVGLPLCYEDCMAVRQEFCLVDWALIEDNKKKASYIRSRGHFSLPDCESLPRISQTTPTCSNAHLTDMDPRLVTHNCVIGNGRFYLGFVNKTRSGLDCQSWAIQEPHIHDRPPDVFPQIQNAENYCRNAGGDEPMPWCYTIDQNIRWELCNIPICDNSTNLTMKIDPDLSMETFFTPRLILIVSSIGFVCVVGLLLSILLCQRLGKHHRGYNPTETQFSVATFILIHSCRFTKDDRHCPIDEFGTQRIISILNNLLTSFVFVGRELVP